MALFKHRTETGAAPFKERRTKGRLVAFNADVVAAPVPSPRRWSFRLTASSRKA